MLEEILDYIHNYFVVKDGIHRGTFKISSGSVSIDFLKENQYFKIVGSVFNDGIYKYPTSDLQDEEFEGEIWAMAVPPAVLKLEEDITNWQEKYGSTINSPYQSESFGGYSYTKASGSGNSGNATDTSGWRNVFGNRLNHWRKIS